MAWFRQWLRRHWHDPATRWPLIMLAVMLLLLLVTWLADLDAPVGYRQPLPPPAAGTVAL